MITISLRSPTSWTASVRHAAATWPEAITLVPEDDSNAAIQAAVLDVAGASPWPTLPEIGPGRARATIFGRSTMEPHRLTAWARRTVLQTATNADRAALTAWEIDETIHDFDVAPDTHASPAGRNLVRSVAAGFPRLDDVLLALSELTTNALNHGGGPQHVAVATSGVAVAIEITDRAPSVLPSVLPLGGFGISGRGMAIVNSIADHWGVTTRTATKTVWCEFLRPR
ncbi:MAG: ATP-binding protein [Acidimicrobiia bacterium]